MRGDTHIIGGITLATGVSVVTGLYIPENIEQSKTSAFIFGLYLAGAVVGSLLPDIDKRGSTVSNRAKIVSFISRLLFTHRSFTHSLLAMGIIGAILLPIGYLSPNHIFLPFAIGVLIGFDSHLLLDALNPTGIKLFFPFDISISFAKIKTGGFFEKIFKLCLFITLVFLLRDVLVNVLTVEQLKSYIHNIPVVNKFI